MKYILIFCLALLLSGTDLLAQADLAEKTECTYNYDDLFVDFNQQYRLNTYYLNGQRFTGCVRQDAPNGNLYVLHYVKDGHLERQVGYYRNGVKCRDYTFNKGFAHGVLALFYVDGSPYIRETYHNGQLHGKAKRWKNGQLLREADYWYGTMISEKLYEVPGEEKYDPPSGGLTGC
ncbi:MAG TPA: hypothetical protein VJ953_05460 [Saprospiraceae bacterium]|nr:hypothetical protein [Saprospiraceae bacterium]